MSSSLFGVNISLTAIISTATAGGTRADNSPGACILRIRQAISRLLEINPGELLFLWPPKLHFHYLLRNAGQTSAIVSFTQKSIRATARVNGQWPLWLWLIIWGFINQMLAGGQVASKKIRGEKKGVSSNGSSENCYLASQIAIELFLPPGFHRQVLQGEKKN